MIKQTTFHLSPKRRGCHLVTHEILEHLLKPLPQVGMLNIFLQHTSCALTINENYDPDVRTDMDSILNHMVNDIAVVQASCLTVVTIVKLKFPISVE